MNPTIFTLTEGGTSTPSGFTAISTVLESVWDWFGGIITTANANPVMWVGVAFGIAGATIGLLRRATRVGGRRR